jgi:uncharacterized protein DUF3943
MIPTTYRLRSLLSLLLAAAPALAPPAPAAAEDRAPEAPGALRLTLGAGVPVYTEEGRTWFHLKPPFADPDWKPRPTGSEQNTWIALGEVVGINVGMWFVSYWAGNDFSKISFDTIGQNFRKGWIIDTDPYWVNQFGHPYEGHAFYTAGRSTGHNFYESVGFAFLGSIMWEQVMEIQSPSVNDQVTTPFGGSVLGEVLYRLHRLVLDSGGENPSFWRQFAAFAVSPVAGANRFFFGDKYEGPLLLPPSWIGEFSLGTVFAGWAHDLRTGATNATVGPWVDIGVHIIYGVPGTPDLRLKQPFDHFEFLGNFAFTNTSQRTATLLMRGLVVGEAIGPATDFGGLWGLFASYDVISIPVFDASGFGLGPGVSLMKRWSSFELRGTAAAEFLPWGAGGAQEPLFARDYHFGPGGEGVLELRGSFRNQVILDLLTHAYWISGAYAKGQSEDILWARANLTIRLHGPHAVSASADWSRRHGSYPYNPSIVQHAAVVSAHYTLLDGW